MRVEYLNKIIDNNQQYNGMYCPCEKVIQIDSKINVILKVLTTVHELLHWVLNEVAENLDIYEKFSDVIDKIQDILPW